MRTQETRRAVLLFALTLAMSAGQMVASKPQAKQGSANSVHKEIEHVLTEQAVAWNRGDIPGFLEYYWKSPELTFSGANGVTRGWDGLLARYRRTYPDRAAMGKLTFSNLEIRMLSADAALVLGRWQLEREKDKPGGVFTLVMRKLPAGWRVIHDHTSDDKPR